MTQLKGNHGKNGFVKSNKFLINNSKRFKKQKAGQSSLQPNVRRQF